MAEKFIEKWDKFERGLDARAQRLPRWIIPACIAAFILAAAFLYLYPSPREFPMDDAYIHFVYAENLAEHGKLFFSFPDEKGLATSSFLWVVLLAAGHTLGIPVHLTAKALGVASLILVGIGVYLLLRSLWTPLRSAAAALLVSLSGNLLWFSLNGMETTLFLALGVLTLLSHRAGRWGWFGFLAALLTLTRPEGLFLLAAIGLAELLAHGRLRREFVLAASIGLLLAAPWYGYIKLRTGHFLPTSASAKQFGSAVATNFLLEQYHLPKFLGSISNLLYPAMWIAYLLEFGLGGMALPPPKFRMAGVAGSPGVDISVWAFLAAAMVIWLMYRAGARFFKSSKWISWSRDPRKRELLILFFWVVLHNLAYMLLLPIPGTASRYGAVNYIILWIGIVAGFSSLARISFRRWVVGLFLLVIALANGLYWNRVYDANIEHMLDARIAAARYVRENFSDGELCAAFDVGSLRYYSDRPLVEIAALMNPDGADKFFEGGADDYLVEHGVTCLVLPGRTGQQSEGILDFAAIMGLTDSPLFEMELVKVFEIDHDRWLLGYLPTVNYQASVTIYWLRMK
ncbi:MAG: hypothetical protein C4583_08560 [Anaerolineaceae bacterium]|nr:MAG: hypothetical protein C4583_08560 [Anaerolineaceae bacterium]